MVKSSEGKRNRGIICEDMCTKYWLRKVSFDFFFIHLGLLIAEFQGNSFNRICQYSQCFSFLTLCCLWLLWQTVVFVWYLENNLSVIFSFLTKISIQMLCQRKKIRE